MSAERCAQHGTVVTDGRCEVLVGGEPHDVSPDWMTAAERNDYDQRLREVDDAVRRAGKGLCARHGAPLFLAQLGGPWLVCRHCLENLCEACEQPASLCTCGGAR